MGYVRHHAIIVTSKGLHGKDHLATAHALAVNLGLAVSPVVPSPCNGCDSFLVASDGSKENWPESDEGDRLRAEFVRWLDKCRYGDRSTPLAWVEVMYGDDQGEARVITHEQAWRAKTR